MAWRTEGRILSGGDVGGDYLATDSFSVRYTHTDRSAVVDVYAYGIELPTGGYGVEIQTETTVCEDTRQPGGTELWSEATHSSDHRTYPTPQAAEQAAQDAVQRHRPSDIRWDGRAPWEKGDRR